MISIDSAEISNRGDISSSSDVMAASGEAGDGFGDAMGADVLMQRLWMVPCLQLRDEMCCNLDNLKHVEARRIII
jgi:hypothetical protein